LLRLHHAGAGGEQAFFTGATEGHLDLARARAGGFGGGVFAVFCPEEHAEPPDAGLTVTPHGYTVRLAKAIAPAYAQRVAISMAAGPVPLESAARGHTQARRAAAV